MCRLIVMSPTVSPAPAPAPTGVGAAPPPEASRDPRRPMAVRVDDLPHRLALDEARGPHATDPDRWDGLSSTAFRYGAVSLSQSTMDSRGTVQVTLDVTNTGTRAGDEVVQLYTHQRRSRVPQPPEALRGFQQVHLEAGQTRRVTFSLAASDLRIWDATRNRWVVESATQDILVGTSSADIRSRAQLEVRGDTIPPRDLRAVRAADFDGSSGTVLAGGTVVAATAAGQWLCYADADLCGGPGTFTARAAVPGDPATLQVRLDDPVHGRVVATVNLPATADVYTYADITARLPRLGGRHDVYLVFGGPARLSTFSLR
ncbi:fibronectin type III-like domain-contianing protein [Dactylosporangium vinaceum]|uniref:Fibronectin type III-like domain-contianing protein n=1 Tax=Dactylosporangium vinaceum TaxID=53362 RepID=A0ABV5MAB3_9ACTN|nr:fibronectin type III-like domain-contianing protein [Dactylosporangium vinaceum]UAB93065.1 fibronectin type III-like domain-contianing protein [Dactylosporangium vinaceum]